ncbi:hypothetical protein GLOTRDRAFT_109550 [Gloeophyllum trabeum ATCC 11539]|uniref:GTP cyclohydrolase II n=1 Tax=Gloeophyllum trabeum (strain ATCC 11539 / FP-39264 / Madison 617) TaxID=670483 RepID=S7RW81_GLOTA|nr:uncharacterized protein GLOTRDRAFT_109550 [Gloeophyllum trabeum ATCC 11539]EPQ59125.1 hypothetical protein GLOTRDRAFT_109550 [Gloeophyllum trabeum ATCC 11539]
MTVGIESPNDLDLSLLDLLTAPSLPTSKTAHRRRDAELDPLLLAAALASGPHVTRNHYHHDFFPPVMDPQAQGAYDWTKWTGEEVGSEKEARRGYTYLSRQAPRSKRLQARNVNEASKENHSSPTEVGPPLRANDLPEPTAKKTRSSSVSVVVDTNAGAAPASARSAQVEVKCMARTRIPTPHGPAFLHLYHNNRDNKEHLAIVVDPAQLSYECNPLAPPIRSRSLDAIWSETETEMDRITRGAYVGRLSPDSQTPSKPLTERPVVSGDSIPSPLIRIHSECFTGETIGSMRCDCGEQLDEAIRLISQPITIPSVSPDAAPTTIPGRGAVVYLRQEGRGIGLLSKIRAYNLQDLGHDTVTANLMLGHQADERGYEIAAAILRDLGLGTECGEGVRLLTNNPDKVQALEQEGLRVVERVPMIPRSWQRRHRRAAENVVPAPLALDAEDEAEKERRSGATLIGGGAAHGEDLEKYLRTKVLRMGHMLPIFPERTDKDGIDA